MTGTIRKDNTESGVKIMSNRAYANVNKVENIKTGKVSYEINIFDNYEYGSVSIESDQTSMTDIEVLQYLKDYGSDESTNVFGLIDSLLHSKVGITINDTFYKWNKIKHLFGLK